MFERYELLARAHPVSLGRSQGARRMSFARSTRGSNRPTPRPDREGRGEVTRQVPTAIYARMIAAASTERSRGERARITRDPSTANFPMRVWTRRLCREVARLPLQPTGSPTPIIVGGTRGRGLRCLAQMPDHTSLHAGYLGGSVPSRSAARGWSNR